MNSTEPKPIIAALRYVKNTNGGATPLHFMEDHNPIGAALWRQITDKGYATTSPEGRIMLTTRGAELLEGEAA